MTTVRIFFEKCGESAYISLLDLQRVFHRMLKMSSLPVYYTQGFNPHIYLSFTCPLSLGQESLCESCEAKTEQERMNEAKAVLYMTLSHMQMYVEETALSTNVDCSAEWVRLYLATMVIRGCTEMTVESYRQEYTTFFHTLKKAIPDITTGDIRGYLAHCKLVRHNKDVPLTLVADLAGHKNLNTTKDNYGNYNRNKAREAHRKFVTG